MKPVITPVTVTKTSNYVHAYSQNNCDNIYIMMNIPVEDPMINASVTYNTAAISYIYIYIYIEREREREVCFSSATRAGWSFPLASLKNESVGHKSYET